jgi:hypothetical protein
MRTQDLWLPFYFLGYVLTTGLLFIFLPRFVGDPYLMPWDYSWVFLAVSPSIAGLPLIPGVRSGRFRGSAVAVFVAGTLLLGVGYWWLGEQLTRAVSRNESNQQLVA